MIKKIHFTIFIMLQVVFTTAQQRELRIANKHYEQMDYINAQVYYLRAIEKGYEDVTIFEKLGNCYYKNGQLSESLEWYDRLIKMNKPDLDPEYYFRYVHALKSEEKYTEADEYMLRFANIKPNDQRSILFLESKGYLEKIDFQSDRLEAKNLEINSKYTDFGAFFHQGDVVYASAYDTLITRKRIHKWNNEPFLDLYIAKLDTSSGELQNPKKMDKKINTRYHESSATYTKDGNTIYFTRNNFEEGNYKVDQRQINRLKIFRAYRKENGDWSQPRSLPFCSDQYSVSHPALSLEEDLLYFVSDMPGSYGDMDLFKVRINEDGTFGTPENLGKRINTEGKETFPFISATNQLYFSSTGHYGLGGLDIFVIPIRPKSEFEDFVVNVGKPVNSPRDDFAFYIDEDSKRGFFSSNREGGKGLDDIYAFQQSQILKEFCKIKVEGIVKSNETDEVIQGAKIKVYDEKGELIDELISDGQGKYQSQRFIECGSKYVVSISKLGYETGQLKIETPDSPSQYINLSSYKELKLVQNEMICVITITGTVKDDVTDIPIANVQVSIYDQENVLIDKVFSNSDGVYRSNKSINCGERYNVIISKFGYKSNTVFVDTPIAPSQTIDISDRTGSRLTKLIDLDDIDIEKINHLELNPVYFDYNKSVLSSEAKKRLTPVITSLKKYKGLKIYINAHTDSRGRKSYNLILSKKRANSTKNYLVKNGIQSNRIIIQGYGESRLTNECRDGVPCSEERHSENRRSEFEIKINEN